MSYTYQEIQLEYGFRAGIKDTHYFKRYDDETHRLLEFAVGNDTLHANYQKALNEGLLPKGLLGTMAFLVSKLLETPDYLLQKVSYSVHMAEVNDNSSQYHFQYGSDQTSFGADQAPFIAHAKSTDALPPVVLELEEANSPDTVPSETLEYEAGLIFEDVLSQAVATILTTSNNQYTNLSITANLEQAYFSEGVTSRTFSILIMTNLSESIQAHGFLTLAD